jgi:predicted branched-subunit amino acid permease
MAAGGIPPLQAMAMSVLVYAGASMLAATQLIAAGAPALVVVLAPSSSICVCSYSA